MTKIATTKPTSNHLYSLVLLRSIAVILVCFCHFGFPLVGTDSFSSIYKLFQDYAHYGVQIFFVISGFIIPYSLFRGNYKLRNYPQFLYKRVLRLHPPYLAALAFTLGIMYASYHVRHLPFPEDGTSILKSIFYLHIPGDNPVFWTLIAEVQYYIFIGLFYIVLMNYVRLAYFIVIPALLLLSHNILSHQLLIAPYLAYFFLGNIGYMIYTKNGERISNFIALVGVIIFIAFFHTVAAFLFSVATIAFILLFNKKIPSLPAFIGKISYSIYLIHFPLGVKLINFFKPRISPGYSWLLFSLTTLLVIAASWVFYKIFEEFSERLSKGVKYKPALAPASQADTPQVPVHS